jgi:CubicO group peptidase (beta-lactamase class C family)
VKNGKIVHETYYRNGGESSIRAGFSTTKTMCASLYGIAVEQGWASVTDRIANKNANTRQCDRTASFSNVLDMTGQSSSGTGFSYDAIGDACLDTLQDFISANNPEGLSTRAWKDKHWQEVLGMEHTQWGSIFSGDLQCGYSAEPSCRDLARAAQLWANEGEWPGAGQLMSKQFAIDGRRQQSTADAAFAYSPYGYTLWLNTADTVDPEAGNLNGMFAQCAYFSHEHNAVIVSMGQGSVCGPAWQNGRHAIVSSDHPLYNSTRSVGLTEGDHKVNKAQMAAFKTEVLSLEQFVSNSTTVHSSQMSEGDLEAYQKWLKVFKSH